MMEKKQISERLQGKRFNGDILRFANLGLIGVAGRVQGGVVSDRWFEGLYMEDDISCE